MKTEIQKILNSKDTAVQRQLEDVLSILIKQYGVGYDCLKTLCIIKDQLSDDLETLKELN